MNKSYRKNLDLIAEYGMYADMIYRDALDRDWDLHDWSTKDEYGNYEENVYINSEEDFIKLVEIALDAKELVVDNLYNGLIELSNNPTLFFINADIDIEEYWMHAGDKLRAFEVMTGTDVYTEGRSSRHICVDNNLMNAYRYEELQKTINLLEQELIDQINGDYNESC